MKTKIFPLFSLMMLGILFACTHNVTVSGDEEHPVVINAEVKIHVYQHAAKDVDDIMEGIDDEEPEAEEPTSMISKVMTVVQNFGVSTAYAAKPTSAEKNAAKAEVKTYYRQAYPYLKKGILGENKDGFVELVNKNPKASKIEITKAAEIADKLNAARKKLYEISAALTGTNVRIQQEAYSTAFRSKAKKGIWIQRKKGSSWVWVQKK